MIRRADSDDFPAMRLLLGRLDTVHHGWRPELFRSADEIERSEELLAAMVSQKGGVTFLYERDGRALGLLCMAIRDIEHLYLHLVRNAHIHHVVVLEEVEGTGVARELMNAAMEAAREEGAVRIELSVFECNERARAFYAKLGFETETRKLYRAV